MLVIAAMALPVTTVVFMSMMAALYVGLIGQSARQEVLDHIICRSGHAAVELNPRLRQRLLRPGADAAADQHIHLQA